MYCWGSNTSGQLGLAGQENIQVNFQENAYFQDKPDIQKVVCGGDHALFLLEDGTIYSCGQHSHGQLGRRTNTNSLGQIYALEAQMIVDVSCGKNHSVAVCNQGDVYTWGEGTEGELGAGTLKQTNPIPKRITGLSNIKILQISCGDYHSIVLTEDGRVFSWGQNNAGQLGLGKQTPNQASPQLVKSLTGIPLVQVNAGGSQSFALSMLGTVFVWGRNNAGQLGFKADSSKAIFKPHAVNSLRNLGVVYISCGDEHTAVLTKDGSVYTFGDDTYGQLGQSTGKSMQGPQKIEEYEGQVSQVACGSYHTLLYVFTCNRVVSFGRGLQKQHGGSLSDDQAQLPPDFDISSLVSANDLMEVSVKWIFAGNNSSFASSSRQEQKAKVTSMDSLQKISRVDRAVIKKWMKAKTGTEEYQEAKREINTIFSSASCLTASFLRPSSPLQSSPLQLDFEAARNVFAELNKDKRMSDIICSSFKSDLIPCIESLPVLYEALAIIILLPECSVMHDPSYSLLLVIPFASAVNNLNKNALKILVKLWSSMKAPDFEKQIQLLKASVVRAVQSNQMDSKTKELLEMLKKLYKANMKANCIVPINSFCINELCPFIILPKDLSNWRLWQSRSDEDENQMPVIYCRYPFIFNFITKVQALHIDSVQKQELIKLKAHEQIVLNRLQMNSDLPKIPIFHLRVRRSHLVEDTLHKLSIVEDCDLQKQLQVEFIGETSSNPTAVVIEFFLRVFEEMVNPDYGLFRYSDPLLPMWFPSSPSADKKKYFYFGILCGLAICNQMVVYLPFPLALFKKILDKKTTLDDLKELQPTVGRSMQEILDYGNETENLEIYFCLSWENKTVELIPTGASIPVTNSNKNDFVNKSVDYIFNTSVAEPFEEFKRGLYKVCDKDVLSFFQPDELMVAVTGTENYNWTNFEMFTIYLGKYSRNHPTINMFWKVFHDLPLQEKKGFLFFLTGNNRIPLIGNLVMRISSFGAPNETFLPEAQTCFQTLLLPEYSNIKTLRRKLLLAIRNNRGFEKI
ncbi:probable E3 ubiquitin-protein ligase HERC6 [Spea bombifrons]|uniref:probable E3 ubiquitin-protein ligase HERC6 n=1 Tax=Spea bombifrons TaxID=233779 RepID=UPI00234B65D6|nr:probable E3 ubiquitin-protein ligase HERC6 [Spea bombifrons]